MDSFILHTAHCGQGEEEVGHIIVSLCFAG